MTVRGVALASLAVLLVAVAVAGAASAHRQLGSNRVAPVALTTPLARGESACQDGEDVPAGTGEVRVFAGTYGPPGPALTVTISGAGLGTVSGRVPAGWHQPEVAVPIAARHGASPARVCVRNDGPGAIVPIGNAAVPAVGLHAHGRFFSSQMRFEYTPGHAQSWWSIVPDLARRAGNERGAFPGAATLWIWGVLMVLVIAGSVLALLGRRRVGTLVAVVGLLNALAWGLVTPPFQVPDEPAHFYYASYLSQTGQLPRPTPNNDWYSPRMTDVLRTLDFYRVVGIAENKPPWSAAAARSLHAAENGTTDPVGRGDASTASSNSPEYYALQAIPYSLSPSGSLLDRLMLMRVLSAVLSALTVACVFGFLRELLPGSPWVWPVGALAAAMQPLFGFISSGVNNDGLLYLASAFVLMMLARCFRRGLTAGRGALLGLGLGIGILAKTQLLAYVPAVGLALALWLWRPGGRRDDAGERPPRRVAWRGALAAVAAGLVPLAVYFVLGRTVWHRPPIDRLSDATGGGSPATLAGQLSYFWQLYLPRLPFLNDMIPGSPLRTLWVDGLMGRLGWLDYDFPSLVNVAGGVAVAAIVVAAVAMLVRARERTLPRLGELVVYAGVALTLCAAISWVGYRSRLATHTQFEQARYLLPLLPLYAAAVALALRVAGRRWGPVLGAAFGVLVLGHTVFAQLMTITRYFG